MPDYTTESVRSDLAQTSSWRFRTGDIVPAFDRWLADHDKEVAASCLRPARQFLQSVLEESNADEATGGSGWDVEVDARTLLSLLDDDWAASEGETPAAPECETCGKPSTYRLGIPSPSWCDDHGPKPTPNGETR